MLGRGATAAAVGDVADFACVGDVPDHAGFVPLVVGFGGDAALQVGAGVDGGGESCCQKERKEFHFAGGVRRGGGIRCEVVR
jgi:hypothetical protein